MSSFFRSSKRETSPVQDAHKATLLSNKMTKGTAFSLAERERFGLAGLFPAAHESLEFQVKREVAQVRRKVSDIDRYEYLMGLLDRNVQLFYRVLVENVTEMMPYVYTPTVGQACREYSMRFSNPRGLYVTINDKGKVQQLVNNWPEKVVTAIVFTDGERILGLGDLGVNGMGIPVGKLQLYSACGGIDPAHCLPVCIDVGTNNEKYLADEFYMGIKQNRVRGKEYDDLIEEFMHACVQRWGPTVLLQFEDFGNSTAFHLLERSRKRYTTFNDDIQGTASVTLGGALASLPLTARRGGPKQLKDHVFVFLGAGEAGTGIAQLIAEAIRIESGNKISVEEARKNIWLVDSVGLVTADRTKLAHHKQDFAHKLPQSAIDQVKGTPFEVNGLITSFEQTVRVLRPTALIGVSAIPSSFTEPILEFMADINPAPLIFALSNPTSQAECTAKECYQWTQGKGIYASGSPFAPVTMTLSDGTTHTFESAQCNNSYIFPGLALGVINCKAKEIPDELMYTAAAALAELVTEEDLSRGSICPPLRNIREISAHIAVKVAEKSYELGVATLKPKPKDMKSFIAGAMVTPGYSNERPPLHNTGKAAL